MSNTIVITGSTKGIGYGLAEEFIKRGHNVVVSGRNQERLDKAAATLSEKHKDHVASCLCDVTSYEANENLFAFAKEKFGRVDIWINNAGVAHPMTNVSDLPMDKIHEVVDVNVYGSIYGSRVAIKGMEEQGGWIYNLEGFGSSGRVMAGLSIYGMTKAAATFFGRSLAKEVENTKVKVATIQPGMVITDMVTGQYKTPEELNKVKPIFNIIANRLVDVVPWIADQILTNEKNGAVLQFQPRWKLLLRFATAPFIKRNLFDD